MSARFDAATHPVFTAGVLLLRQMDASFAVRIARLNALWPKID